MALADGISKFNFQDLIWQSKNGEDHCYKEHIGFVIWILFPKHIVWIKESSYLRKVGMKDLPKVFPLFSSEER